MQNNLPRGCKRLGWVGGASNQRINFTAPGTFDSDTCAFQNPQARNKGEEAVVGGQGLPKHQQLLPRGKAVSNHRIQKIMNHSHQILEITDLRNETSRNSSSLGFHDICSFGSPPGPQLTPAVSSAAFGCGWGTTAHAGLSAACSAHPPWPSPSSPVDSNPDSSDDRTPTYALSKHFAPPLCQLLF